MNKIMISGRVVETIEIKAISEKANISEFTVAVKHNMDSNKTNFVRCKAWNKQAEVIAAHFEKGDQIILEGEYMIDQFITKEGKVGYSNYINISSFDFGAKKKVTEAPPF